MKNLKNQKAQESGLGDLIIFVVIGALVAGFVWFVYITGNQVSAEIMFRDDASSVTLIADAVANTPNCLLNYETKNIAGNNVLAAQRGVVDWDKARAAKADCVKKGPYIWDAVLLDETLLKEQLIEAKEKNDLANLLFAFTNNIAQIKGIPAECSPISKVKTPVLIKRGQSLHRGILNVSMASTDVAITDWKRKGNAISLVVISTGSCQPDKVRINMKASIVETDTDLPSGMPITVVSISNLFAPQNGEAVEINIPAVSPILVQLPDESLEGTSLKIELTPEFNPGFTKTYLINVGGTTAAPLTVTTGTPTDTTIPISWNAYRDADFYRINIKPSGTTSWYYAADVSSGTSYTITTYVESGAFKTLQPATSYDIRVIAESGVRTSPTALKISDTITAETL